MFYILGGALNPVRLITGPLQAMLRGLIGPVLDALADLFVAMVEPLVVALLTVIADLALVIVAVIARVIVSILARLFMGALSQVLMVVSASPEMLQNDFVIRAAGAMQVMGISIVIIIALYSGFRSFFSYFGYEADEPWKVMVRAGVSLFLVAASIDIAASMLNFLSVSAGIIYEMFGISDPTGDVSVAALEDFSRQMAGPDFDALAMPVHLIVFILIVIKTFILVIRYAERFVQLLLLTIFSPIAYAFTVTKQSGEYFKSWFRVYIGAYLIQIIQVAGFALLLTINIEQVQGFEILGLGQALLSLGCLALIENAGQFVEGIVGMGASAGSTGGRYDTGTAIAKGTAKGIVTKGGSILKKSFYKGKK